MEFNKRYIGGTIFHLISLLSGVRLEIEQFGIFGRGHPPFGKFSNLKSVASQPLLLHAPRLISFLTIHHSTLLYHDSLLHHHPIWEWETLGGLIFGIGKFPKRWRSSPKIPNSSVCNPLCIRREYNNDLNLFPITMILCVFEDMVLNKVDLFKDDRESRL